jgi:LytS/YehU family sensor histidine kinase
LEKRLAEAKLQALQMQLNPHFLFNTLHSISALMHRDVEAADRMIVLLSDLLRRALDGTKEHEVPLAQELDLLDRYLEIERTRFGDRLSVEVDIAPETLTARVPNLILQPLVENAIKHGIERVAGPRKIQLQAQRRAGRLILAVSDDGAGLATGGAVREGIGLSNTRARLQELYGQDQQLALTARAGGGLTVTLELPFHKHDGVRTTSAPN